MRPTTPLLLLVLCGCPAEQMGVIVPRGGAEAITMEDLKRDTWDVSKSHDRARWEAVGQRLQQMHTLPVFNGDYPVPGGGGVCGQKDGEVGAKAVVVLALDDGTVAGGAVPLAALISLAKAWDSPERPGRTIVFCAMGQPGAIEAYRARPAVPLEQTERFVVLERLGTGAATSKDGQLGGVPATIVSTPVAEVGVDALDYKGLAQQVVEVHLQVEATVGG